MASLRQSMQPQEEKPDNRFCSYEFCNRLGSICFSTHPGPETKWFCTDHAFPDRMHKPTKPKLEVAKSLNNFSKNFEKAKAGGFK
mgnify:FL=1